MPEEKTVDIDTSGPDVDINLPEEKDPKEVEVKEEVKEETKEEVQEPRTTEQEPEVKEEKINGINVTVPFKKSVIPFVDELEYLAKKTQSVNTIYKKNEKVGIFDLGNHLLIIGLILIILAIKVLKNDLFLIYVLSIKLAPIALLNLARDLMQGV